MLNATYSEYYGTCFEAWMWEKLHAQHEAHFWQDEPWRNWKEGSCEANPIPAEPGDMTANPYRRYCKENNVTSVETVSRIKYVAAVVITAVVESFKRFAGTVEALISLPLHPIRSLHMIFKNAVGCLFFTFYSPFLIYNHTHDNRLNISGLYKDFRNQRNYMDDTDIPLWKIYSQARKA